MKGWLWLRWMPHIALDLMDSPIHQLIMDIKKQYDVPIMAEISTLAEGVSAAHSGADAVSTTLSGYTDYSPKHAGPNIELIRELVLALEIPVIAEGRVNTPNDVRAVLEAGAFSVVVGSMITRPHLITEALCSSNPGQIRRCHFRWMLVEQRLLEVLVNHQGQLLIQDKAATPTRQGRAGDCRRDGYLSRITT